MAYIFWDASALSKRYTAETGIETVDALFDSLPVSGHCSTVFGYVETYAILRRRFNGGALRKRDYEAALSTLQEEIAENESFLMLRMDDAVMYSSIFFIEKHNLNSTDAALLTTLLDFACSEGAPVCVMVSADKRLLRAAAAEKLPTLDPETASAADAAMLLASL